MKLYVLILFNIILYSGLHSQILGELIGTTIINNQTQFVRVNPNTGFVTQVGNQTSSISAPLIINIANAAFDCGNNNFVFSATYNSQNTILTIDKSTGNIISSFGYNIFGLTFNQNNGLYYGLEFVTGSSSNYHLVAFDPINGLKNTITSSPVSIPSTYQDGYTLDLNNNKYLFLKTTNNDQEIYSIDINTGTIAISSIIRPTDWGLLLCLVHNNMDGKTYTISRNYDGVQLYCQLSSIANNGTLTGIGTGYPSLNYYAYPNGTNNPSSGYSINTASNILTYGASISSSQKKIVNVNLTSGTLVSNPTISVTNQINNLQYATCNSLGGKNIILHSNDFNIYPNPTNETLYLDYNLIKDQKFEIKIFGVLGNLIFKANVSPQLDVSVLQSGSYLFEITNGIDSFRGNFIKN